MRDMIGVIFLVQGDGRLGSPKPRRGGEGVDGVHLLLCDAALPVRFVCLGAPEDHEEALGPRELVAFFLGVVC
jgi:hypothetical protein